MSQHDRIGRTKLGEADGAMDVSLAVASDSDRPIDRGPAAPLAWRARRAGTPTTSRPVVGTETMVIGAAGRVPSPRRQGARQPLPASPLEQRYTMQRVSGASYS